ncbi:MAG: hypothetical protein Udaeo2_21420 [Candidatus Udaeobacter sp.]|nr:MAG: hypothetical protein Udaeo2_21420 [Candidatus Udaeobacter sp.]
MNHRDSSVRAQSTRCIKEKIDKETLLGFGDSRGSYRPFADGTSIEPRLILKHQGDTDDCTLCGSWANSRGGGQLGTTDMHYFSKRIAGPREMVELKLNHRALQPSVVIPDIARRRSTGAMLSAGFYGNIYGV